jgi:hypothetical protein
MRLVLAWLCLWVALPAWGNTYRFGLFVGNDEGLPGDPELVFAELDAQKMHDLFVEYGAIPTSDAVLLQGASVGAVEREFQKLSGRIGSLVQSGHEVVFVFYYSGHGDDDGLHLGASRLEHVNLRTLIERTGAQLRIGMVDACQSGGLVRRKGGQRGPDFAFAEPQLESVHGTAIITSSAASELSQESDEIGGGFFSHYLHTALSGAADRNRDGEVTLSEAYSYVHTETTFRTKDAPESQTPNWDIDLSGAGDVTLTTLEEASARLAFLGDLDGTFSVWDESRRRYVAQISGDAPVSLAVRPGTFFVHQRMPGWIEEARYTVRRGETHSVLAEDFVTMSYESSAARGDLERVVRRSQIPDLSLQAVMGFRVFGGASGQAEQYFGPMALGGLQGTLLGSRRRYWSFDLRTGAAQAVLPINGLAPVQIRQGTVSLGGTIGFATRPGLMRTGFGGRSSLTVLSRSFPEWDIPAQSQAALGVGLNTWAGLHHGRFSGNLQLDWQLLVMKWDDNAGWPVALDLALVLGYRF